MRRRGLLALIVVTAASSTAAAAATGRVVPWLDVHPAKAAAHPPLAPPCGAVDLRADLFLQGATGSLVGGVNVRNVGSSACSLVGWPKLSFTGRAATRSTWRVKRVASLFASAPDVLADPPGSLRALAPGKSAAISLWWSNWCGPASKSASGAGPPPAGLAVGLPGGTTFHLKLTYAPRCDDPQLGSTLETTRFAPAERQPQPRSRLPLAVAIASPRGTLVKPNVRSLTVRRGHVFRYEIAVTNTGKTPFRLAPTSCPVYIEALVPSATEAYVLNCRPVGAIAPGARVLFAMRLAVPAAGPLGNGGLSWELAPRTSNPPFATAAVTITR